MPTEGNLRTLTDEELDQKITKIQSIMFSRNFGLSQQAQRLLPMYVEEQSRRASKKFDDYLKKTNTKPDDIINIG